ncbi:MAG: hypothetical protein NT131_04975 [Methanomassiliicoccales archaeon]|nr:hypothetical protein [Methanomassiliicoccales archaeon]
MRSRLEVPIREKEVVVFDPETERRSSLHSFFGEWHGSTVLCSCGALVRIDQAAVRRRRMMGKPVECHQCRNRRVALEHEDIDMEFYDREGE